MANLLDYLEWRGDLTLEASPWNEVDGIILARFSYLPLASVLPSLAVQSMPLNAVAEALLSDPDLPQKVLGRDDEDISLLRALRESRRFSRMQVSQCREITDNASQTQFSAVTVQVHGGLSYLSFRGTDNTLVGWKEDFNMGFICPVPAQQLALAYFQDIADSMDGEFILGGHSKGGNLAVYAAAFGGPGLQARIRTVYNFDGPGFMEKILAEEGYQRICQKVRTLVPQSSIVGMLLGHEEKYSIVHSTRKNGILQHDVYSWEVQRDRFVPLETVTNSSRFIDFTLKEWIANMNAAEREAFVDAAYQLIAETNARTLRELSDHWFETARTLLKSAKNLDDTTRQTLTRTLFSLMRSTKTGWKQVMQKKDRD